MTGSEERPAPDRPRATSPLRHASERTVAATYAKLAGDGVYTERTRHGAPERELVASVLGAEVRRLEPPTRILEVGCGAGPWLEAALEVVGDQGELSGFDLSEDMAALARTRLKGSLPEGAIWQGSVLDDESYRAPAEGYDIIFAYDLVQQLPPKLQLQACQTMMSHLADRGSLIVFDHDSASPYGRRMGMKKAITRYLRVPLVPRYYLVARYPRLRTIAEGLLEHHAAIVRIATARGISKQALIAQRRI